MELVQGVGGVRPLCRRACGAHISLPLRRARHGYLLLIDEVQTGMYRTGPFTLSGAMGLTPDLLVVGKAVSDMMFPFALTLYSARGPSTKLDRRRAPNLPDALPAGATAIVFGYKTALNVLRFAEQTQLAEQVAASGPLFQPNCSARNSRVARRCARCASLVCSSASNWKPHAGRSAGSRNACSGSTSPPCSGIRVTRSWSASASTSPMFSRSRRRSPSTPLEIRQQCAATIGDEVAAPPRSIKLLTSARSAASCV